MDILESKQIINDKINIIFESYQHEIAKVNEEVNIMKGKLTETLAINKKLMEEVSEKDKLLHVNEKKMVDYEVMINQIQEEASKELTEKERFSMLKAKDREIHDRDNEIKRLTAQLKKKDSEGIEIKINEVSDKRVDRMKKVTESDLVLEPEPKVDKEPKVEDTEVIESEVTEIDAGDSEEDDGDECSVVEITYKKKKYYIIEGEKPQYMYEIEDEGLGKKVGEVKGKRKVLY